MKWVFTSNVTYHIIVCKDKQFARKETKMAKMSAKMERVLNQIRAQVEYARTHTYKEWLGNSKDYAFLRALYEEQRDGLIHGLYDGRTLAGLEKRGYIKYFDDMVSDDWAIRLIEE